MSVIGVDPGLSGAFALYDQRTGSLTIEDMPTWWAVSGKKKRQRVDPIAVLEYFELGKMLGVELCVIEAVGARPGQSGMFTFGYSVGLVYMACVAARIAIENVSPQTWKRMMHVTGKSRVPGAKNEMILARANEVFPDHRNLFYGTQGGKKIDRAEAAMIAKYAADYALPAVDPRVPLEQALRASVNAP